MTGDGILTVEVRLTDDSGQAITTRIEWPITVDRDSERRAEANLREYLAAARSAIAPIAARSIAGIGADR